jgi:uncharacterized membrane-anchored protein
MWPRHWRIVAVIGVQLLILAAVPGRKLHARARGTEVSLETRPIDPYDFMSGYYVTLGYKVETAPLERGFQPNDGDTVYITIQRDTPGWRGIEVTQSPVAPTANRLSLRATWEHSARLLDAQRLYVPETQRRDATETLRTHRSDALVDLRVDADGTVALERMRVGGKSWGEQSHHQQ